MSAVMKEHSTNVQTTLPEAFNLLGGFIGKRQLLALAELCRGEEREYFRAKVIEMAQLIHGMPTTGEQDGRGDDAVVYLHYFLGSADFHITEKDVDSDGEGQIQAFGLANLGYGAELGYISLVELAENNVEIDLHFAPRTLAEVKAGGG